jgi:hypothetical protein
MTTYYFKRLMPENHSKITYTQVYKFIEDLNFPYKFKIIGGLKRRGWTTNDIDYILMTPKPPRALKDWDKYILPIVMHFHKQVDCFIPVKSGMIKMIDPFTGYDEKIKVDYLIGSIGLTNDYYIKTEKGYLYTAVVGQLKKDSMEKFEQAVNLRRKHGRQRREYIAKYGKDNPKIKQLELHQFDEANEMRKQFKWEGFDYFDEAYNSNRGREGDIVFDIVKRGGVWVKKRIKL